MGACSRGAPVPVYPHDGGIDATVTRMAKEAPLSMKFDGTTAAEAQAWQSLFADKLRSLLGPHRPPARWTTRVERVVDMGDHERRELLLEAEGHPTLPVYLLAPRRPASGKLPGVLALHGHLDGGYEEVAGNEDRFKRNPAQDYGRKLVEQGFVVAIPCFTPFGRRLGDATPYGNADICGISFIRLQLFGRLLMAENLRDAFWALDLLATDERVDANRLGCVGQSLGGRMAMLASALDPRIKVAAVSGALNVMQERVQGRMSCGAQVIPGLLAHGDVPEIGGLIAPRPCVWEVGSKDGLIPAAWAETAIQRMRRVYEALGAPQNLIVDRFEGPHRWNGTAAYPLLRKVLQQEA